MSIDVGESASETGEKLSHRIGPLPLWGWGIAGAAGIFIAYRVSKTHGGAITAVSGTPSALPSRAVGGGSAGGGITLPAQRTGGVQDTPGAGSVVVPPLDIDGIIRRAIEAMKPPASGAPNAVPQPVAVPAAKSPVVTTPQRPNTSAAQTLARVDAFGLQPGDIPDENPAANSSAPAAVAERNFDLDLAVASAPAGQEQSFRDYFESQYPGYGH